MGKYKYTKQVNELSKKDYFYVEVPNEEVILKYDDTSKMKAADVDSLIDKEIDRILVNRNEFKLKEITDREAKIAELQSEINLLSGIQ